MRIISGRYKGKQIQFIKSQTTRPLKDSVKESIFNILMHSNKINIKKTIEEIYKVKVQKLNSLNVKSKPKVFKGQRGTRSELKRIIVTLKEGNTIDMSGKV